MHTYTLEEIGVWISRIFRLLRLDDADDKTDKLLQKEKVFIDTEPWQIREEGDKKYILFISGKPAHVEIFTHEDGTSMFGVVSQGNEVVMFPANVSL